MNNPMIKFPSIGQFRDAIKQIQSSAKYFEKPIPTLTLVGSVKVHGSNAAIVRKVGGNVDDIYCQSRERILSIESDNAGFAAHCYGIRESLNMLMDKIQKVVPNKTGYIQVFGEWAGGNIQKAVGVNGLPKFLNVFAIRISESAESTDWEHQSVFEAVFNEIFHESIYHKYQFKTWELSVDFANPGLMQNELVRITDEVEADCPVARFFKPDAEAGSLIGEGVVWVVKPRQDCGFDTSSIILKVKGEKHSVSKVKTTAMVDVEKVKGINEFVDYAVTENRLNQMFDKMIELQHPITVQSTGAFIKIVQTDVFKEELDTMVASLLEVKDVAGAIAVKAKNFWMTKCNESAGI